MHPLSPFPITKTSPLALAPASLAPPMLVLAIVRLAVVTEPIPTLPGVRDPPKVPDVRTATSIDDGKGCWPEFGD